MQATNKKNHGDVQRRKFKKRLKNTKKERICANTHNSVHVHVLVNSWHYASHS